MSINNDLRRKPKFSVGLTFATSMVLLLLIGGGGYTVYNSLATTVDTSEMITSLEEMQSELYKLKESVSNNIAPIGERNDEVELVLKDELELVDAQIGEANREIDSLILDIYNSISENNITYYTDLLDKYTTISGGMDTVTDNIDNVNNQITNEISYLSANTSENHKNTIKTLNSVYNELLKANNIFESNISSSFKTVNQEFKDMKTFNEKGFDNLEDMMTKNEKEVVKTMAEDKALIVKEIDKLDKQYSSVYEKLVDNNALLNARLDNDFHILNQSVEDFEASMKDQTTSINKNINDQLFSQTTNIENDLSALQIELENKLAESQASLEGKIASAQASIEGKISGQTASLEGTIDSQTIALEGKIGNQTTVLETKLGNQTSALEGKISDQTTLLEGKMDAQTTLFEGKMDAQTTNLENKILEVEGKVGNVTTNQTFIKNQVDSNASAIAALEAHLSTQDATIQSVFQSASEGKKKLAATLTGYGIPTANNASFYTINENLKKAYTKAYTDGVKSVGSPSISYVYHQHKTSAGAKANYETTHSNVGGCFTKGVHQHIWNGSYYPTSKTYQLSKSGCYQSGSHSHQISGCSQCGGSYRIATFYETDNSEMTWHKYQARAYCDSCGDLRRGNWYDDKGSADGDSQGMVNSANSSPHYSNCTGVTNIYYTTCNNTPNNTFSPSCGFKNGEVEQAIISYK